MTKKSIEFEVLPPEEDAYRALRPWFPAKDFDIVEVTDPLQVVRYLDSKASSSWACGVPIENSGFYSLELPTPEPGKKRLVFVCREAIVRRLNDMKPEGMHPRMAVQHALDLHQFLLPRMPAPGTLPELLAFVETLTIDNTSLQVITGLRKTLRSLLDLRID